MLFRTLATSSGLPSGTSGALNGIDPFADPQYDSNEALFRRLFPHLSFRLFHAHGGEEGPTLSASSAISWHGFRNSLPSITAYRSGHYYYIETTKGKELWVMGVPFMDSMSFVFLAWASYSMALMAAFAGSAHRRDALSSRDEEDQVLPWRQDCSGPSSSFYSM